MSKGQKQLNYDFEPLLKKSWIEKIESDLKGKSYYSLKSQLEKGMEAEPVYTSEDINDEYNFDWVKSEWLPEHHRAWFLSQQMDSKHLNSQILDYCKEFGIDTLDLSYEEGESEELFTQLMESSVRLIFCKTNLFNAEELSQLNSVGKQVIIEEDYSKAIQDLRLEELINSSEMEFGAIAINFSSLLNNGLSHLDEGVLMISLIHELHRKEKIKQNSQLVLRLAMGSNFYLNIIRIRVIRKLSNYLLQNLGVQNPVIIECHTGSYNKSIYDRDTNMLRNTSEAFAALSAGADILGIYTFDHTFSYSNEFGIRNAANISNLLEFESHLDKSDDMAKGSYALEKLSVEFAEKLWTKFQDILKSGGIVNFCNKSFLKTLAENKKANEAAFSSQKLKMTGTNIFPNSLESISQEEMTEIIDDRLSSNFDSIRLSLDNYAFEHKGSRIKAHLIRIGNHPKRFARATFSANFLAAAGFECIYCDETPNELGDKDVLVLCGDDDDYTSSALKSFSKFSNAKIIAGNPENRNELSESGANFFIHLGAPLEDSLRSILNFIKL